MDDYNHRHHLSVSNFSRIIKKEPQTASATPQPTATRAMAAPQHVYNISKSDFRSFVQQMTGTDDRHSRPRPAVSGRFRQIRPPPLAAALPAAPSHHDSSPLRVPAESPVSAYIRHLESTLLHSDGSSFGSCTPPPPGRLQLPSPPLPCAAAPSPAALQSPSVLWNIFSPNNRGLLSQLYQLPPPSPPTAVSPSGFYFQS